MYNDTLLRLANGNYGGEGYWMGAHHGPFMWIVPVLIIIAVIAVISRLWRSDHRVSKNTALDVLAQRFANGEIDENEYREKRNVLKSRH